MGSSGISGTREPYKSGSAHTRREVVSACHSILVSSSAPPAGHVWKQLQGCSHTNTALIAPIAEASRASSRKVHRDVSWLLHC